MEYRICLTLPNLPLDPEEAWAPLVAALERDSAELGPVIGWRGEDAEIIVATESDDAPSAVMAATKALVHALLRAGLYDRYPAEIEVQSVADDLVQA